MAVSDCLLDVDELPAGGVRAVERDPRAGVYVLAGMWRSPRRAAIRRGHAPSASVSVGWRGSAAFAIGAVTASGAAAVKPPSPDGCPPATSSTTNRGRPLTCSKILPTYKPVTPPLMMMNAARNRPNIGSAVQLGS